MKTKLRQWLPADIKSVYMRLMWIYSLNCLMCAIRPGCLLGRYFSIMVNVDRVAPVPTGLNTAEITPARVCLMSNSGRCRYPKKAFAAPRAEMKSFWARLKLGCETRAAPLETLSSVAVLGLVLLILDCGPDLLSALLQLSGTNCSAGSINSLLPPASRSASGKNSVVRRWKAESVSARPLS